MLQKVLILGFALALATATTKAADTPVARTSLTAAQIVDNNVSARGGLQAWRSVKSLAIEGKLGAGGNQRTPIIEAPAGKKLATLPTDLRPKEEIQLPFKMELQRPRMSRFELLFNSQTALQIYDGANGWKLRPYLNRREVEPFTDAELKAAAMQADLDGHLVDYAAKGTRIELDGMEKVEDRDNYKLKLTLKSGQTIHIWIDAQTFLETKIEGQPRRLDGIEHPVEIYYRDYRPVSGLQIPFTLETKVLPVTSPGSKFKGNSPVQVEKISIEKVEVNPKIEVSLFSKPQIEATPNRR